MNSLKLDAFLQYQFLSGLTFSPDGRYAAFVNTKADASENTYDSFIWLYRCSDGQLLRLTGMGKESGFLWEDGSHILFPAVRSAAEKKREEEKDQFTSWYRISVNGGEAEPAFTVPLPVLELKQIDEKRYLVTALCDSACPDYYKLDAEGRKQYAAKKKEEEDYEVLEEVPFWFNGSGLIRKHRSRLFLYTPEDGTLTPVTEPEFHLGSAVVLGETIYYTGEFRTGKTELREDIYAYRMDTGETECVYDKKEYWIPDMAVLNDRIILLASEGKRFGRNENTCFYTFQPSDKTIALLSPFKESLGSSVGSDCRFGGGRYLKAVKDRLFFLTTIGGASYLYAMDCCGTVSPLLTREGSIDDFDISPDGETALTVAMYGTALQEIYSLKAGTYAQASHFNDAVLEDVYLSGYERITFPSVHTDITGWVLKPADYDPEKSYPAVLDIHGGPRTVYGEVFYHEMQYLAGQGYFVFFCNPTGSDGRGDEFADIRGAYGTVDYQDLMNFTDRVLELYPQIDRDRLAVTGGSYGGFMTNWIIGHTDRFACAASQRSISNWISFYGVSDIGTTFGPDQTGGDIYRCLDKIWEQSPLKYAENVKTPTLFIHSDQDYRCPLEQGLQMYTALADRDVPARLCLFKGENHELSRSGKPAHRVRRLKEITEWIQKYTGRQE